MVLDLAFLPSLIITLLLVFGRIASMVMLFPGFSHGAISVRVRLLFALIMSMVFVPLLQSYFTALPLTLVAILAAFMWEIMIGLFFGACVRLIMFGAQTAGNIIAQVSNLAALPGFDLMTGEQTTPLGTLLGLTATVLIFTLDLHHMLISGMVSTYSAINPGLHVPIGDFAAQAVKVVSASFAAAMQLSAPFIVLSLILQGSLGILSRLMPQLQVYFIAIPFNLFVSIALLLVLFALLMSWYADYFSNQAMIILGLI